MTKEEIIEILDKYDYSFILETGEIVQGIIFHDFGKVAQELASVGDLADVSEREDVLTFIRMVLNSYKLLNNDTDHRKVYQMIVESAEKLNNKLVDYANARLRFGYGEFVQFLSK